MRVLVEWVPQWALVWIELAYVFRRDCFSLGVQGKCGLTFHIFYWLYYLLGTSHETNKVWLNKHEYLWICQLGTLIKLSKKCLNKLIYDPNFHSNTDI